MPSIDLLGGRVVRLRHGDPGQATVYAADPLDAVERWAVEGARALHVVDLDGAFAGAPVQSRVIAQVVARAAALGVGCQVAGGIRDEPAAAAALEAGAARVVLGTVAVSDPGLAGRLVALHGAARVVAALDVRDGLAVGEGWRSGAPGVALGLAVRRLLDAGIAWLAVTAIARDGVLTGPDLALLATVRAAAPGATLVASAGIRDAADLVAVRDAGANGAIVGRAAYERTLTLAAAREALARGS